MGNNNLHDPLAGGFALSAIALSVDEVVSGMSGGNAQLGWVATGLDEGDQITISTDGFHDFGSVMPILVSRMTLIGIADGGLLEQSDGRSTMSAGTNGLPTIKDIAALPNGKGVQVGTDDSDVNSVNYRQSIVIDTGVETEFYESCYIYWPAANQANAAPSLDGSAAWNHKPIWHFDTPTGYNAADKTDIFAGTSDWYPTGQYWVPGNKIKSNSPPISSIDTTNTELRNPLEITEYRANPIFRQFWVRSGASVADPTGSKGMYRITDTIDGLLEEKLYSDENYADADATRLGVDRFSFPGFVRGFNKPEGSEIYYADVCKTAGSGAVARLEITDNADYSLSKKYAQCTVTALVTNEVIVNINKGIFYTESLVGKHMHYHDSENSHTYVGQL